MLKGMFSRNLRVSLAKFFLISGVFITTLSLFILQVSEAKPTEGALKMGFVDVRRALVTSKAGSSAKRQLESEQKKAQVQIDEKQKEFVQLKESLDKLKDSLNDKARIAKEEELLGLEKDLKRNFQDSQESLRREEAKILGELVKKIRGIVDEVGRTEGFTVILEKEGQSVLYADNQIDITDRVVSKFDAGEDK